MSCRTRSWRWPVASATRSSAQLSGEVAVTWRRHAHSHRTLAARPGRHVSVLVSLVAPDEREEDVRAQLRRPAFQRVSDLHVRYPPYGELEAASGGHGPVRARTQGHRGGRARAGLTRVG